MWQRVAAGLTWQDIDNKRIAHERNWYLRQNGFLELMAARAELYLHYIVGEVEKRGMPMEIALLPMVESNFNPFASSTSYAAGMWQIMPATGRHLGLTQDWWFDGRRDLRESTRAALDYLEDLNRRCDGDWMLTLASYNAGKARVSRARRSNARHGLDTDFWSLKKLPRETRRYVPRLIALAHIVAAPERFGATLPSVPNRAAFEVVATGGQLEFARAASLAGIEAGALRDLNPGHLRWATAPSDSPELLLPVGLRAQFEQDLAQLSDSERVEWQHYKIVRGDSLIRIAQKFDVQVKLLKDVNGIRGSRIRAGDTMLIPSGDAWASSLALSAQVAKPRGYRVRRGDSLYRIAGRFKVSVNDIIAWNALDPKKYLQPGQKLTLYVTGG